MFDNKLPFDSYPHGGRKLISVKWNYYNSRRRAVPTFMKETKQTCCAYCGMDFTESFNNWRSVVLDHVVPQSVRKSLGIRLDWIWDFSNAVLACSACNGYNNRYKPEIDSPQQQMSQEEFFDLRDRCYRERKGPIMEKLTQEEDFFNLKIKRSI